MAHAAFLEGDGPVWGVVAHRRGNLERSRQFGVDCHLRGGIHILGEPALAVGVREHEALDVLLSLVRLARVVGHALGENSLVVDVVDLVVADVLNDHRRLLRHDERSGLLDELLGVHAVEPEHVGVDTGENRRGAPARNGSGLRHLAHEVVGHAHGRGASVDVAGLGLRAAERRAALHLVARCL